MLVFHQYRNKLKEECFPFLFLSLSDSYSYSRYLRKKVTLELYYNLGVFARPGAVQ